MFNAAVVYDALGCDGDFNKEDIGQRQASKNCTNFDYIREALDITNEQIEAALKNKVSNSGITKQQLTDEIQAKKEGASGTSQDQ